jgi:pimeloyl-ACP methyl ester carboxylesterase
MKIDYDESKYADVPVELKERFFSFADDVEIREIQRGSRSFRYIERGPRDAKAVVFFTGGVKFPLFSFSVIEALSRELHVIAPAQPQCRTISEFLDGVNAILETESIAGYSVAGSSWGGQVAQVAVLNSPQRVDRAVLANTGISSGVAIGLALRLYRWAIHRKKPEEVVAGFRKQALGMLCDTEQSTAFWTALFDDLFERYMTYEDFVTLIDTQIDYVQTYSAELARGGFATPVLILSSANESAGSAKMRSQLRQAYPNAEVYEFSEGGHHPALLHLQEYQQVVEEFLQREDVST